MEKKYPASTANGSKKNVLDFASYIASLTSARITGVFLERHQGQLQPVLRCINETPVMQDVTVSPDNSKICCGKCRDKNHLSGQTCISNQATSDGVSGELKSGLAAIIKESRFSDLLILDAQMSIDKDQAGVLSELSKAVLTKSECPVMIAPYAFESIEEIIFAYDGSPSAVFAIKQFTWLFPGLSDKKLTVLQVNGQEDEMIKDRDNILSLLQIYYTAIGFRALTGVVSDVLFNYLNGRQNAMVIMGAFGSRNISVPAGESTAGPLVKTINLPLFTAHHR